MTDNIETLLKESRIYQPSDKTKSAAYIKDYETEYKKSIADPEGFWSGMAKELDWFSPWSKVLEWSYPWAKWFVDATCNITYNCLDRHVKTWRKNKVALIWVGENDQERIFTYAELYRQVNRCANALKKIGIKKGDRVTIYLPKIPEQVVAMLACARLGIVDDTGNSWSQQVIFDSDHHGPGLIVEPFWLPQLSPDRRCPPCCPKHSNKDREKPYAERVT